MYTFLRTEELPKNAPKLTYLAYPIGDQICKLFQSH